MSALSADQGLVARLAQVHAQQRLMAQMTVCFCLAAAINETSAAKQHKLQALRQAAALYKQRLGLSFEHASGQQWPCKQLFYLHARNCDEEASRRGYGLWAGCN